MQTKRQTHTHTHTLSLSLQYAYSEAGKRECEQRGKRAFILESGNHEETQFDTELCLRRRRFNFGMLAFLGGVEGCFGVTELASAAVAWAATSKLCSLNARVATPERVKIIITITSSNRRRTVGNLTQGRQGADNEGGKPERRHKR